MDLLIIDDTRAQGFSSPTWPLYLVPVAVIILAWEVAKDAAAWVSTLTLEGATAATVSWATTPSISPLVAGLFVAAATGLTVVVVWTWENPYAGLKDDTRGQAMDGWPVGAMTMLVVLGMGIAVGEMLIGEVDSVDAARIETTCLGVWGCGSPSLLAVATTLAILVVVIGTIAYGVRGGLPR